MLSVASLLSGMEAVSGMFRRSASAGAASASPPGDDASPAGASGETSRATLLQELSSRHDLRNISPDTFSNLVRQLHEAGLINDRELQDLAAVRLELDLAEVPPDKPLNLIEFLENKLQRLHGQLGASPTPAGTTLSVTDYNEATDRTMRQLGLLRELQQARSGPGLDATI